MPTCQTTNASTTRLLNMSGTWRGIVQSDVRLTWKWACATMPLVKGCLFTATPTYHPSLSPSSPRSMALCNLNFLQIFPFLPDLITDVQGVHRVATYPSNVCLNIIQGEKINSNVKTIKYFLLFISLCKNMR